MISTLRRDLGTSTALFRKHHAGTLKCLVSTHYDFMKILGDI